MKSTSRFLILLSAGLTAGAMMGAGAAQAAPPAGQSASTTIGVQRPDRDRDEVRGYYDSERECEWAGRRGERNDRWDDYDCDRVFRGPHRGDYKLTVSWDRDNDHDWDDDDDDHGHHGGGHH